LDQNKLFTFRYVAGEVPRDYFTEPLPADWDSGPSKYLTAANFREVVMEDASRPKLVMWYAPWCGHCKNIMKGGYLLILTILLTYQLTYLPILTILLTYYPSAWEELGEKFPSHLVGRIDATVNEVPGLPAVHTFPTIKLYRCSSSSNLLRLHLLHLLHLLHPLLHLLLLPAQAGWHGG
jgi:protein disulfide-isomerase A1